MSDATEGTNKDRGDDDRDENLSALAQDVSHPFDQTNGIVDGLEGNADDPEQVDARTDGGEGVAPLIAPPGAGAGGGTPIVMGRREGGRADTEVDDEPEGP